MGRDREILFFDQTLKKIGLVFRFGGINIKTREIKRIDHIRSRIIFTFNILWSVLDTAGSISWFIDGVRTGKDFLSLTFIAPCVILTALAYTKGLLLIANENNVYKLIENLRNFEMKVREKELMAEELGTVKEEKDFVDMVITVIQSLYAILATLFALSPIVVMSVKYSNTGELELMLPFLVLYPFDAYKLKVFPFIFLHQVWSACVTALCILSADCFFFTCCTYIRIQFKLLQHSIDRIIPVQDTTNNKFFSNDEFSAKFKDLVLWHQDLIDSVQILENIYSKSTLLNFASSSMIICLSGFNVAMMGNDIVFVATFLSFLVMGLFQVFFLCFFADLLMAASMEISEAVYKTQWYMAEVSIGKKFSIMQIRGQKPCKLTAYGFADVNLNSFMRVLSTAWSYFALLQTIYGN